MADKADAQMFAEDYVLEGKIVAEAGTATVELGVGPVSPDIGVALRTLAATAGARTVSEVGTGTGVSGLWLLDGMPANRVLTSIGSETEFHQQARRIFAVAGVLTQHTRLIAGHALDVLPRMAARDYDMMVLGTDIAETPGYLDHAVRILRPDGVVAFVRALWHDQIANPVHRDGGTIVCREVVRFFADFPDFIPATLLVRDELVVAVRR